MKVTLSDLLDQAKKVLPLHLFPEQEEELYRIVEKVFKIKKYQINQYTVPITKTQKYEWDNIISQREEGKPLSYILGYTYFYQDCFPVSEQTLIPRYDTEHLVEAVRTYYSDKTPNVILDIGTGTGAIAISLHRLFSLAKIIAVDIVTEPILMSLHSLAIDNHNIVVKNLDILDHKTWNDIGFVDCIVSNPPYLDDHDMEVLDRQVYDFEPHRALYGSFDGMVFYKNIVEFASKYLCKEGLVVLEVDHKYEKVRALFPENLFKHYPLVYDYNGLPRVFLCVKINS